MNPLGIGGVSQSAATYLQQLAGQQSAAGTAASAASTQGVKGAHHHRHQGSGAGNSGGTEGSQAQVASLLDTIASALQSTDASSDPNQVIEDTVAKLLENNSKAAGANESTGGVSVGTVQAAGSQASSQPSFAQLLQSHGISVQQFQSDLLAAVKDAQNGKVNPATALQSLPPGSALNLTA
jgi:hypothetical protein